LMEVFEGTLEIISTAGESFLGGEDFTDRLIAGVLETQGVQLEFAELRQPLRVARLRQQCEVAKQQLAKAELAQVRVPDAEGRIRENAPTVDINRDTFARLAEPLVERLKGPVAKAMRDGRASPGEIQDVILVGGATRMPLVGDFVREFFEKEPLCKFNPDEVV